MAVVVIVLIIAVIHVLRRIERDDLFLGMWYCKSCKAWVHFPVCPGCKASLVVTDEELSVQYQELWDMLYGREIEKEVH